MHVTQSNNTTPTARLSALTALEFSLDKGKPIDTSWAQDQYFSSLTPPDRAFSQLLAKTTIRRLGQIDELLGRFVERKPPPRVFHILRLGAAQLLFLNTPPHAAVNESVEMTRQVKMEKFSGLVNAVLKKVVKQGKEILAAHDEAKLNTPDWLWESWVNAYGEKKTRAIAAMHLAEPTLDISVKSDAESWADKLGGTALPSGSIRLTDAKNITQLEGFEEGAWWVQDVAAALPATLLGDVSGQKVIDICAAPGGKTMQLAAAGAEVTAVELVKARMNLLKINLERVQLSANCVTADALKWTPGFTPDAILLDAPCSATGTLRKHPDVAHHRNPKDIARLKTTQYDLLNHALEIIKPGGTVVYAVCSLQPEEGENQISRLINERKDVKLDAVLPSEIGGLAECLTDKGELRTLPCHLLEQGGMDGFYAARLTKV